MGNKSFVGYEYQQVAVKSDMSSVYADGYENFGWKLENSDFASGKPNSVVMRFKRDRKIRNKPELTRLQRQFDSIVSDIVSLESSKRVKASIVAYIVGIVGIYGRFGFFRDCRTDSPLHHPCHPCIHRMDPALLPVPFH